MFDLTPIKKTNSNLEEVSSKLEVLTKEIAKLTLAIEQLQKFQTKIAEELSTDFAEFRKFKIIENGKK